ncbi:MAG TPA: hypothetical protein VHB79_21480 [Polyangiaceae bacterium]|nr:hypothetical protein [Polyangiaceae bacterium]
MSRSLSSVIPVLLVGALLAACGGKSFENGDDPNGGSGNTAGSSQAGSANAGSENGGTDFGGTGSGGSGQAGTSNGGKAGASSCDAADYPDEMGGSVPVRLINGTNHPIYLGPEVQGCGGVPLFQVADGKGQPLSAVGFCQSTCAMMIQGTLIGCPAIACAINSVITLQPGESTMGLWNTLYTEQEKLPPVCSKAAGVNECQRIVAAKPGDYIFSAQAGSNMTCGGPTATGTCGSCDANGNGGCVTYGAVIAGPLLNAKVEVMLDGSYGLGGPGGGGMVREVMLEFK